MVMTWEKSWGPFLCHQPSDKHPAERVFSHLDEVCKSQHRLARAEGADGEHVIRDERGMGTCNLSGDHDGFLGLGLVLQED